jgi:hypothetical protein
MQARLPVCLETGVDSTLLLLAEAAKTQSKLNRIDAGVGGREPGVGNVHVADFGADVVLAPQEMQAQGSAGGEIDPRSSRRHLRIGEKSAAANFEVGNDTAASIERPFEGERIQADAVSGILFLKNKEGRNRIKRVFQTATQETGTMRGGKNQTVAQTDIPNAVAGLAPRDAVASASPDLHLVFAFDGTCLRASNWNAQEKRDRKSRRNHSPQRGVSSGQFEVQATKFDAEKI